MKPEERFVEPSQLLSDLIAFDDEGRALWPAEQLRSVLAEPLACLAECCPVPSTYDVAAMESLATSASPPISTFAHVLQHSNPPINLLWMIKDLAKTSSQDRRSTIPPDISLLLYYGAIAAALVRCHQRISRLSDEELRQGFNWVVRQPWIDGPVRNLFLDSLRLLRSSQFRWRS